MEPKRRPKGTGSLKEVSPGRWRIRVFIGTDPVTGRPRQVERLVDAKTYRGAQLKLDELRASSGPGSTTGTSATVRTVVEEFIRHSEARGRAANTIHVAKRTLENVIGPEIGDIPVADLNPRHLDELYRRLITGEGRGRPIMATSIRRYNAVLSAALSQAVRWGWIETNPATRATLPQLERSTLVVPTAEDVARLIRAAGDLSPIWGVLVKLAVVTGARRGELCALRWTDVDRGEGVLHVRKALYRVGGQTGQGPTKGRRERKVALDPATAWLLDDWRKWCGVRAEKAEVTIAGDGFIASTWPDCSRPLNVDTFSSTVGRLCAVPAGKNTRGLSIPHVHLHSLRHFAATELLAGGVSPSDTAQLLGHADGGQLALRTYAHATDERQRRASGVLARALDQPQPT